MTKKKLKKGKEQGGGKEGGRGTEKKERIVYTRDVGVKGRTGREGNKSERRKI